MYIFSFTAHEMDEPHDQNWSLEVEPTVITSTSQTNTQNIIRRCVIHLEKHDSTTKDSEVNEFNESTWDTVRSKSIVRRRKPKFNTSLYYNVVLQLPESPDSTHGYHSECYSKFTAIPIPANFSYESPNESTIEPNILHLRSASVTGKQSSSVGLFPPQCMFCDKIKIRKGTSHEIAVVCQVIETWNTIYEAAKKLHDSVILSKISGIDLIAKEAKYHHSCKSAYLMKASRVQSNANTTSKSSPALENITAYVEQNVLDNKRPELLTSIYSRYVDFCNIAGEEPISTAYSLRRCLLGKFGEKLKYQILVGKKLGVIMYSSEITEDSVRVAYDYTADEEQTISKAAIILRKQIFDV